MDHFQFLMIVFALLLISWRVATVGDALDRIADAMEKPPKSPLIHWDEKTGRFSPFDGKRGQP